MTETQKTESDSEAEKTDTNQETEKPDQSGKRNQEKKGNIQGD